MNGSPAPGAAGQPLRLSVVIPTYLRPGWLARAVRSLAAQATTPFEVIAVARDTDAATHRAIAALQASGLPFPLRQGTVTEPGFMPPVRAGFALAAGDVVAVMDDDAEAQPGWTDGLLRHYGDPGVGAVGGRCINMEDEVPVQEGDTARVGYVNLRGHFVGDMYKRPTFTDPVEVEFLMGGCMSYRRQVASRLEFDEQLNHNVAFAYEVDLGLQVRRMGLRLLFDPGVAIKHYSAPREIAGARRPDDKEAVFWCSYNEMRVALRRLPWWRSLPAFAWRLLVGERRTPGLLLWAAGAVLPRLGVHRGNAGRTLRGRLAALTDCVNPGAARRGDP